MTVLPVRPDPRPSEPLSSYAARLADANGLTRSRLLLPWRHDIDIPRPELDAVASLAGLDADAAGRLTMNRYPLAIRGHGPQRRHGWRLHHAVVWICPACTIATGHADLLWQTALMPVCLRCRCYLVQHGATQVVQPADPLVLELAAILGGLAEAAIENPRARQVLYRLRRRCHQIAETICTEQPLPESELPCIDLAAAQQWGAYPSPDPGTVATLLVLGGRHLTSVQPRIPTRAPRHLRGDFTPEDQARLDWFVTRLRRHVALDGLHPRHVPSALPLPLGGRLPQRAQSRLTLTQAAIALHMTITRAVDAEATPRDSARFLGVTGLPPSVLLEGIRTRAGLGAEDAALLGAGIEVLLADGLIDYQRRREVLRAVTRLPSAVRSRLPGGTRRVTAERMALGWIWTRFTLAPMRSSTWPDLSDHDVDMFDRRIDPEIRLLLHDVGLRFLADADPLSVPTSEDSQRPAERRFG